MLAAWAFQHFSGNLSSYLIFELKSRNRLQPTTKTTSALAVHPLSFEPIDVSYRIS